MRGKEGRIIAGAPGRGDGDTSDTRSLQADVFPLFAEVKLGEREMLESSGTPDVS